jgi:hypothetical protein
LTLSFALKKRRFSRKFRTTFKKLLKNKWRVFGGSMNVSVCHSVCCCFLGNPKGCQNFSGDHWEMIETVRLTRGLLQLFQELEWVVENGAAKAEWVENMDPQETPWTPKSTVQAKAEKLTFQTPIPLNNPDK